MRLPIRFDPIKPVSRAAIWLASYALLPAPQYEVTAEKRRTFESCYRSLCRSPEQEITSQLPAPKREFLAYIAREKPVLLHGSNESAIEIFEPREQTDWRGTDTTAIFATKDALLATFFAVLDRDTYTGSLRNGGFLVTTPTGTISRRYYFSLSLEAIGPSPFTPGTVYLLPEDEFEPAEYVSFGFDEWYCEHPVEPIASITVEPDEFPVRQYLVGHHERESMLKSVALYRWRLKRTELPRVTVQ